MKTPADAILKKFGVENLGEGNTPTIKVDPVKFKEFFDGRQATTGGFCRLVLGVEPSQKTRSQVRRYIESIQTKIKSGAFADGLDKFVIVRVGEGSFKGISGPSIEEAKVLVDAQYKVKPKAFQA